MGSRSKNKKILKALKGIVNERRTRAREGYREQEELEKEWRWREEQKSLKLIMILSNHLAT